MPPNIKDAEVHRPVETDRVAEAGTRAPETLLTLARDIARHFRDGEHSRNHAELYDKDGLPV